MVGRWRLVHALRRPTAVSCSALLPAGASTKILREQSLELLVRQLLVLNRRSVQPVVDAGASRGTPSQQNADVGRPLASHMPCQHRWS